MTRKSFSLLMMVVFVLGLVLTASTNVSPAAAQEDPARCFTDKEWNALVDPQGRIKLLDTDDGIAWEACKRTLQANADHVFEDVIFPLDTLVTYTDPQGVVWADAGDGQPHDVMGATFRWLPSYMKSEDTMWAMNPARFYAAEVRYGLIDGEEGRDPAFLTWVDREGPLGEYFLDQETACPATAEEVAEVVGGLAQDWTAPDWEGGAWTYNGSKAELTVPEDLPAWIDFHGEAVWGGDTVVGKEASFHCHLFITPETQANPAPTATPLPTLQ
jgi:hypothetical protein